MNCLTHLEGQKEFAAKKVKSKMLKIQDPNFSIFFVKWSSPLGWPNKAKKRGPGHVNF
jgi:hypothetical protein